MALPRSGGPPGGPPKWVLALPYFFDRSYKKRPGPHNVNYAMRPRSFFMGPVILIRQSEDAIWVDPQSALPSTGP